MTKYNFVKNAIRHGFTSGREFTQDHMWNFYITDKTAIVEETNYFTGEKTIEKFDVDKIRNKIEVEKEKEEKERKRKERERKSSLGLINLYCPVCKKHIVNIERDDFEDWWDKPDYGYYMQCSCGLRSGYHHGEEAARDWWNDMLKRGV